MLHEADGDTLVAAQRGEIDDVRTRVRSARVDVHGGDGIAAHGAADQPPRPGPQQPLFMAGVEVHEIMFWVPQTGSMVWACRS